MYNVLIVGAGQIGALYDTPGSDVYYSHAHAVISHPCFSLVGFVDRDSEKLVNAVSLWGGQGYLSTTEAFEKNVVDIVVVAVPDELHSSVFREICKQDLKLVLAEKPFTQNFVEAKEAVKMLRDIPIVVNYFRRFLPSFKLLKRDIEKGNFGSFSSGVIYYGKGLFHNGSHCIDLLNFLLGKKVENVSVLSKVFDFTERDPSISANLTFEGGSTVVLQGIDSRNFTLFEFDLIFDSGRIHIKDSGFTVDLFLVDNSPEFKGYKSLIYKESIQTEMKQYMICVYDNINLFLAEGVPLCSGSENALEVLSTLSRFSLG